MAKLKFAIIGPETENTNDLVNEIKKSGNISYVIQLKDVTFEFKSGEFKAFWSKKNLFNFDIFIFRGYNKNLNFARIFIDTLLNKKKVVVDDILGKTFISSKVFEASIFNRNKISHPKTYHAVNLASWKKILKKVKFPIIAKPVYGQKGQGIIKLENEKSYISLFTKNPKEYLLQEFIRVDGDLRVFIVNNKVLGAIKRFIVPGDFRSNASLGAQAIKVIPSKKIKEIAIKATKSMGYEIAGVDIIEDKNNLYVLEVNSSPQWQKFKETTGVNPAREIIKYSLEKYEKIQSRFF